MVTTALIFFPTPFVGFNKTQLLVRQLTDAEVIDQRLKSSIFSIGSKFRQFIPKVESIHKFQYGMIRIQILAVGDNHSNVVLVEGDTISDPLDRYAPFCDLLYRITGDEYQVDIANHHFLGIEET